MLPIYIISDSEDDLNFFKSRNPHIVDYIEEFDYTPINGINKQKLSNDGIIDQDNIYSDNELIRTAKHIELWKIASQSKKGITIVESNSFLHNDFKVCMNRGLKSNPDFDLFVWQYSLNWPICVEMCPGFPKMAITFRDQRSNLPITITNDMLIDANVFQNSSIDPFFLKLYSFAGLGCYSLSPKGAKQLLDLSLPIGKKQPATYQENAVGSNLYIVEGAQERPNTSLDIEMNRHIPTLETYTSYPMLAITPKLT
ncbi:MAG: glycosyltransferase family 25 protein [Commensalibacter sp.]|nr:glycosyltransferase family 25 protein [Commensalibacter sp.]